MTDFALCRTCPEVVAGRLDSSKGWLDGAESNHHHCAPAKPFGNPAGLPAPIRNLVLRLGAGVPIRDIDITMFKLGLNLEDQWTPFPSTAPAVVTTLPTSPVPVLASVASTRSAPVSAPTSGTSARPVVDVELDLFGGVA